MLNQRMLCRAFRPPKLRKNRKSHNLRPERSAGTGSFRWLGEKSLACSQALPPGRVPQVRTSVPGKKKTEAKPPPKLLYPDQGSVTPGVKAFEKKIIFNPGTLVRTWGTRPGGKAWREAGKRRRKDSQPPNRAKVISLFTRPRRVDCS